MKLRALILGSVMAVGLSTGAFAIGSVIQDGLHDPLIDCFFDNVAQGGIRFDPLAIDDVAMAMQTLRDGGGMIEVIYPDGNGALHLAIPTLHPDDNILVISARDNGPIGEMYLLDTLLTAELVGDPHLRDPWEIKHQFDAGRGLVIHAVHVDLRHGTNAWQGGLGAGLSDNAV